jgi:hypothetical protein
MVICGRPAVTPGPPAAHTDSRPAGKAEATWPVKSRFHENEQVHSQVPAVDCAGLAAWCDRHLGSPAAGELFRAGHLARVIGVRLADEREVVVRVRSPAPRLGACAEVQRRLFESGYPCPEPLAGPVPFEDYEASAESYVPGDAMLPASGRAAGPFAVALARLVTLAPRPGEVPSLAPAPAWTAWNHDEGGLWPWPDDQDVDLNGLDGPGWIDDAGRDARRRLQASQGEIVIGHGDWYPENLRWHGNRLLVAYDWDSLIADSEAVIVGLAAAVYPTSRAGGEATVTETRDFLAAYAAARGRQFCPGELQRCWAAGVWLRAFDSKKQYAAGQPVRTLTETEARERLRRAGMR